MLVNLLNNLEIIFNWSNENILNKNYDKLVNKLRSIIFVFQNFYIILTF